MTSISTKLPVYLALGLMGMLLAGLGITGWIRHAADLMLSMGEAGLSWCL